MKWLGDEHFFALPSRDDWHYRGVPRWVMWAIVTWNWFVVCCMGAVVVMFVMLMMKVSQ